MSQCWIYHETEEPMIVEADEAQAYYDDGWKDSPRYFVKTTDFDVDPTDEVAVQNLGEAIEGVKDSLNGALNLSEMKKAELAEYATTHFDTELKPDDLTKVQMIEAIEGLINGNGTRVSH